MFRDKDFLEQTRQAGDQIRALDYPHKVLLAACRAILLEEDGVDYPDFISCIAPSVLGTMSTPLTVDECAYALSDLASKHDITLLLYAEDKELGSMAAAEALTKMKQIVDESGVTV